MYCIPGNFRGMYISRIAIDSQFSRIKFRGRGILQLKFPYLHAKDNFSQIKFSLWRFQP